MGWWHHAGSHWECEDRHGRFGALGACGDLTALHKDNVVTTDVEVGLAAFPTVQPLSWASGIHYAPHP